MNMNRKPVRLAVNEAEGKNRVISSGYSLAWLGFANNCATDGSL
jgi:hypothetical protein